MSQDTTTPDISELLNRLSALESRDEQRESAISRLQEENAALRTAVRQAEEQPEEKPLPKIPDETFTVRGQEYRFVAATFQIKDKQVTATDALSDERLLQALADSGSGVIVAVD